MSIMGDGGSVTIAFIWVGGRFKYIFHPTHSLELLMECPLLTFHNNIKDLILKHCRTTH